MIPWQPAPAIEITLVSYPDVCNVGEILELKEIAAMAEPYFVVISPHNYNSTTIGLAATLQCSTCIPSFLITEYFVNLESFGETIMVKPFKVVDGCISVPDGPGLGLDEEALGQYPYQELPARSLRWYLEEGPCIPKRMDPTSPNNIYLEVFSQPRGTHRLILVRFSKCAARRIRL